MSNVKGMAIALACLISMPALAEDTLDRLHVVMAALADAAVTQCPQYKINGIEFTLWAVKESEGYGKLTNGSFYAPSHKQHAGSAERSRAKQ